MTAIKAIETSYNGYRFRSRLEARWAVFFDKAGIRYFYEHEGYDLGDEYYLPDFYLPDFDLFVEVKPDTFEAAVKGSTTLGKLVKKTRRNGLLCLDDPAAGKLILETISISGRCTGTVCKFVMYDDRVVLLYDDDGRKEEYKVPVPFIKPDLIGTSKYFTGDEHLLWERAYGGDPDNPIDKAAAAARRARFEYGEEGA